MVSLAGSINSNNATQLLRALRQLLDTKHLTLDKFSHVIIPKLFPHFPAQFFQ